MAVRSRVLFIDAYDSFSNNIIALLETTLDVEVSKVHIDLDIADISAFLKPFAAVVCGPGPGHPKNPADVGLFQDIWRLHHDNVIPVLGICLGFQSLVISFGGRVQQLSNPRHGLETCITTSSTSIFQDLPEVDTVQYHSLHATLGHNVPEIPQAEDTSSLWKPSASCPDLFPLAWEMASMGEENIDICTRAKPILMAVRHIVRPYYGVQFHPESVCSHASARQVVSNWWNVSLHWLRQHKPVKINMLEIEPAGTSSKCISENFDGEDTDRSEMFSVPTSGTLMSPKSMHSFPNETQDLISRDIELGYLTVPRICEALQLEQGEMILLDSEGKLMHSLGDASVVGVIEPSTLKIKYSVGTKFIVLDEGSRQTDVALSTQGGDIFAYLKAFMAERQLVSRPDRVFCGGLMGYITYEACLETIGIPASRYDHRPDIQFAFVRKSIVVDHRRNVVHVQSLKMHDDVESVEWVTKTAGVLRTLGKRKNMMHSRNEEITNTASEVQCVQPVESEYKHKIRQCQEHITAGNSYELCLTDQTSICHRSKKADFPTSWSRYLKLRNANPAPFAAFVRLGTLTLLSTSPERFMSWSRFCPSPAGEEQPCAVSTCQFRPIKGTVSKKIISPEGHIACVSKEEALRLLSVVKERAENLMIVDLIRHDLYSVVSSWDVEVKALMAVEEYETVYQLVSVIEGKIFNPLKSTVRAKDSPSRGRCGNKNGIDVLAASLPPGSMTGAPKLRSCQLLQDIERHQPRSIYSGILGYMCVTGKGDFSVVIRSVFKWADGGSRDDEELWRIGAGVAVTALITEEGECKEMLAKMYSTLGGFG